jgi:hypothetical protein
MAFESNLFSVPGLVANADLSSYQHYLVKQTSADLTVALNDVAGGDCIGVLQNKPDAANKPAQVMSHGVTKVVAGGTVTASDLLKSDASGRVVKATRSLTGADVGDAVVGRCLTAGTVGTKISMLLLNGVTITV